MVFVLFLPVTILIEPNETINQSNRLWKP